MSVEVTERAEPETTTSDQPLIRIRGLRKLFPITRGILFQKRIGNVHAVDGVDLDIYPGETVGLVGETGCGKSTLARVLTRLYDATEGTIEFEGQDITHAKGAELRRLRREMQMIFQDPFASLNPRKTVGSIIGEPFRLHGIPRRPVPSIVARRTTWRAAWRIALALSGLLTLIFIWDILSEVLIEVPPGFRLVANIEAFRAAMLTIFGPLLVVGFARLVTFVGETPARRKLNREVKAEVQQLMELVGLNPEHYNRFPHEFSGGQRQRIGVARALALRPKVIVCDEPVSALDVSIQAQVLNLLEDLQEEFNLTYLFIAHDLSVVKHVSDRVAVMYLGKIAEMAKGVTLYRNPKHPYTGALLSAVPIADPDLAASKKRIILEGDVPSPIDPPSGCRFHPRCPNAQFPMCSDVEPMLEPHRPGQVAACHFPLEDRAVIDEGAAS